MDQHSGDLESLLGAAKKEEGAYRWQAASEWYARALEVIPPGDSLRNGGLEESIGHALYNAAFQSDNPAQFREQLRSARSRYARAQASFDALSGTQYSGRALRCQAMCSYIDYWSERDPATKKKAVTTAWNLAKSALRAFEGASDAGAFLETYNLFILSAEEYITIDENFPDFASNVAAFEEVLALGERAIELNCKDGEPHALAEAYVSTALSHEEGALIFFEAADRRRESRRRARDYWLKANELSRETAVTAEFDSFPRLGLWYPFGFTQEDYLNFVRNALPFRRESRNQYIIGVTLEELANQFHFMIASARYPEERDAIAQRSLEMALEAAAHYSAIGYTSSSNFGFWTLEPRSGHYATLAFFEPDLRKKQDLATRAQETIEECVRLAEATGSLFVLANAHHTYGIILTELTKSETRPGKKAELLKEAMRHRQLSTQLHDRIAPLLFWNRGLSHSYLAETKYELSTLAGNRASEVVLLSEAITEQKQALGLLEKELSSWIDPPSPSDLAMTAVAQQWYGVWLQRLGELEGKRERLLEAVAALETAAETFERAGMRCRSAESDWEAAQVYSALENHKKAAEKFGVAAQQYESASAELPGFKEFYDDYALLMRAWSEIETARLHHSRQEPALAKVHFEKAAEAHGRTRRWSYLEENYRAWAEVEKAEDLSHKEQGKDSIDAFNKAERLFKESKGVMLEHVAKIESPTEKQMVEQLIQAADRRGTFCTARVALEEARLLDKQGDSSAASAEYAFAADTFAGIREGLTDERDIREFDLIVCLSKAWQTMSKAEAQSSPEDYEEAASLFEKAKDLSPNDKMKNVSLGHSRFCKALAAGCRFSDSGDLAQHGLAADNLESAARFYVKGDLEGTAEYARASKLLFDAYVQTGLASKEVDQDRKVRFYAVAEKILETAASSFDKAGQTGKKEEVLRLLAAVRQDHALAVTLIEVFHAPDATAKAMAMPSPSPSHEAAAGLDRFEHADVQATLTVRPKEVQVGQDLSLEIEFVNAGKGPAQLTEVERIVPEGFDMVTLPEHCRLEDHHLNMRGKRLDAMNTDDIRMIVKPVARGRFTLRPKVTYLDETGKNRSSEPEPVDIVVTELGIVGWLRGSEKRH